MKLVKKILAKISGNQFSSDMSRVGQMSSAVKYFVAEQARSNLSVAVKSFERFPEPLQYEYFSEQANKAKELRNEAIRFGAKNDSDPLWLAASLLESYYNTLRILSPNERHAVVQRMDAWLQSIDDMVEDETHKILESLPLCSSFVVIGSPEYDPAFHCEISIGVHDFRRLTIDTGLLSGNLKSLSAKVAVSAFMRWIENADSSQKGPSFLCSAFQKIFTGHLQSFCKSEMATVFCFECGYAVNSVEFKKESKSTSPHFLEWSSEWICPNGHVIFDEDVNVHIQRSAPPRSAGDRVDVIAVLEKSNIATVLSAGKCISLVVELDSEKDGIFLMNKIKLEGVPKMIVDYIEAKIKRGEIEDNRLAFDGAKFVRTNEPIPSVKRVVLGKSGDVLMSWIADSKN